MSDSSRSEDLLVSPLPLTQKLRDELDATILAKVRSTAKLILASDPALADEHYFIIILLHITLQANLLLQRENLKDILNPSIDHEEMLVQNPRLRDVIHAACQTGKFVNIADLKILQIPEPATDNTPTPSKDTAKDVGLSASFARPYVGEAVGGFYQYLASNNKKFSQDLLRPYYGKFCSIVQSSGTGKSRLLTELRQKGVLVLYMNLRGESENGFPARDVVPSRILTEGMHCSRAEYTARCCAFFAAIFRTLTKELTELTPSRLRSGRFDIPTVINKWNNRMCDMGSTDRTKFFDKVETEYLAILLEIDAKKKTLKQATDESLPSVDETAEKLGSMTLTDTKVDTPLLEGEPFLTDAYANMLKVLPLIFTGSDDPQLVIGIDEAHPLSKMSTNGFRPSHILCRAINAYSRGGKASIWAVFASTTSQVAAFSAPQPIHDSSRVAAAGQLLYPPYTLLGWDQNANALPDVSANDVAQFQHIAGFGRPLWKSLMTVGGEDIVSIMTVAAQKLSKSQTFDATSPDEALAVLSQRFALDVCFGHPDAVSYIEKGVASHLRICYSTAEDRTWSFTGYPSEPLLSCAAAHLLHRSPHDLANALDVLKKKVDGGMFEIGQSGELTSRLLLLLAKDTFVCKYLSVDLNPHVRAQDSDDDDGWKAELIHCQKVSVIHFLEHLFGDSFWSQAGDTAKKVFKHAYINFSHWVPMDEFISPGPEVSDRCTAEEWTLRHWHRTSAVQCCHLQPLVDKMIPIYFDDPNLKCGDIGRVSQMFVSDKAGKNSNERDLGFITRTHDSIQCLSPLPFIALLLDLNGESKLNVSFAEKEPNHQETDRCLRIYASGVTQATFPFLDKYPRVETLLKGFISKPEEQSSNERLHALVKYGSTVKVSHMKWEAQYPSQNVG